MASVASARTATATTGQATAIPVTTTTQLGTVGNAVAISVIGTAVVVPGYTYQVDANNSYTVFGAPFTVTVK